MLYPTARKAPGLDGISNTVPPRASFRSVQPWSWSRRRSRCVPWLAGAPPRRPASLERLPMSCRLWHFAATASHERLRGCRGRRHHELPARRARNVTTSSAPLMADPDLLEIHRRQRGGLARARHPWSARVQPRDTEASSPFTFDELPLHTPGSRSPSSSPRSRLHGRSASAQATLQGTHA